MFLRKIQVLLLAVSLFSLSVAAQPSAVKSVQKAAFSFVTYDKKGGELGKGNGVFVSADGEAVASFKPFAGAYSVEITDSKGKTFSEVKLLGANEIHNLLHFRIESKTTAAKIAEPKPLTQGTKLFCVGAKSSQSIQPATLKNVETFAGSYSYYIISQTEAAGMEGCPMVTEKGELIGLLETSQTTANVFATDIRYALSLMPQMLSATDAALLQIHLPVQLPSDESSARIAMMMLASGDSIKRISSARDFMNAFPTVIDGYPLVASHAVETGNVQEADEVMSKALKNVTDKASANFEYCKIIYNKLLYHPEPAYPSWTLDKALEHLKEAQAINPNGLYRNYEAQILFSQQKYAEADEILTSLIDSKDVSKSEMYFQKARCQQALGANSENIVALLDSAINNIDSLAVSSAAPYFWMRGQQYDLMGKYREAVLDYSRYQAVMKNRVNETFYYTRFIAEVNGKLYQQALIDIQNCIMLNPKELQYPAEKAQLELRVALPDKAAVSANYCIKIAPESPTGYTLLGLALAQLGKKDEARQNLLKAKELGEEKADEYINKYIH